jgi:hypothetical protein
MVSDCLSDIARREMARTVQFMKKHAAEGIIILLIMALGAIYGYALNEQKGLKLRVRAVEIGRVENAGEIIALHVAINEREKTTQAQFEALGKKIDERCTSLETLIQTLISTLKRNGVGLLPAPQLQEGSKNGLSYSND